LQGIPQQSNRPQGGARIALLRLRICSMPPMNSQNVVQMAKVAEREEERALLQRHLKEVIEGATFRGSHRSGQFLKYIVERAIAGDFESLKERVIGVELFGRSPTYDTSNDAIVRVTASDVRRRLLKHYGGSGAAAELRINLPSGCYIPEITRNTRNGAKDSITVSAHEAPDGSSESPVHVLPVPLVITNPSEKPAASRGAAKWLLFAVFLIGLTILIIAMRWIPARYSPQKAVPPAAFFPWPAFLSTQHSTFLVTSDPNIAEIQKLTGSPVSLSDYATQQYLPALKSLSPEMIRFCHDFLPGDKAANVDVEIVASVVELAQRESKKIDVRGARNLRVADLDGDNNFIFLGSPRSDPWTALFDKQLDFTFASDKPSQQEFILNAHPRPDESAKYVPAEKGSESSSSFATIGFIGNPEHAGQVLLLAGTNAGGTKAAGELATNPQRLSAALERCGVGPSNSRPAQHFQILLRVNTMARSPSDFDVLACHLLR
jgi:hypothetical protein